MRSTTPPNRRDDDSPRVRFPGDGAEDQGARGRGRLTAGVPLAKIIKPRLTSAAELVSQNRPHSETAKRFRRLGAMLDDLRPEPPQSVVVTSAGSAEGKSFVAMNLALAFASQSPGDVLLLDVDLRRSSLGRWIRPKPRIGLAELLLGQTELVHALQEPSNCPLHVLPAAGPSEDPLELLASESFEDLVRLFKQRYRRIVIDTPPIVPFTDADVVAGHGDGVLMVARAGQTRGAELTQAISSVTSAPVLGTLLNDLAFT
jgi:capsular exopolysaccharide synthesis family protein